MVAQIHRRNVHIVKLRRQALEMLATSEPQIVNYDPHVHDDVVVSAQVPSQLRHQRHPAKRR
jgi:hypothetical protein